MSIVPLRKVTLYGLARQRDAVLEGLQRLGCLHLIDLPGAGGKPLEPAERNLVHDALKFLRSCPVQNANQHPRYAPGEDCLSLARQTLENKHRKETLSDERDELQRNIQLLEPWGEFHLPETDETQGLKLWFYPVPRRLLSALTESTCVWQQIHEDRQFVYVVVVSREEPDFPVARVSLDPRPLSALLRRREEIDEELETLHWQRVALTRGTNLIQHDLNEADDALARAAALSRMAQDQHLFALQAWAPLPTLPALQDYARDQQLALTIDAAAAGELPPTLLHNPTAVAGAEGLLTFYITPAYHAWDPTWVVYASFTAFFAMIMSDAAYGAVLGLLLLAFWKRMSGSGEGRRLRNLFAALVVATIAYGIAAGSYFGTTPRLLKPLQLKLDGQPLVTHRDAMMILTLAIGVAHLSLANLITAWRKRNTAQSLSHVGWVLVLVGGLAAGLFAELGHPTVRWVSQALGVPAEQIQPPVERVGWTALSVGFACVFLFSSGRPLASKRLGDWVGRIVDGLLGLTNISKAFGDTLSYLRLFALGLASAQLAVTFNDLAAGAYQVPGLGIVLALLILGVGHGVNLLLGIMSGVVHGLRLNCIEFFNWSLTDEGYPFQPFCKKAG